MAGYFASIADRTEPLPQLAQLTGASARPLYRLLRALASVGVFAEDKQHRFGPTPMGECLRGDVAGSLWSLAILRGGLHTGAVVGAVTVAVRGSNGGDARLTS